MTGALLWVKQLHEGVYGPTGQAIATDAQGNVYIAGSISYDGLLSDGYLAKFRGSDGELIWEKIYKPTSAETAGFSEIAIAPDGGVVAFGGTDTVTFTAKFSGDTGTFAWEKIEADWLRGTNKHLVLDANGDVVIAGWIFPSSDYLTQKLSGATGEVLWQVRFNRDQDSLEAVTIDRNGDVVVTGRSSTAGPQNIYTAKYAGSSGALLWERYDAAGAPGNTLLATDRDRNVYLLPRTSQNIGHRILKISPAGALLWERAYSLPVLSSNVYPVWAGFDSFGNLATVGTYGNYRLFLSTFAPTTGDRLALRQQTDKLFSVGLGANSVAVSENGLLAVCEYGAVGDVERYVTRAFITNTAPVVTLVGSPQLSLEAGNFLYEDPGATVADVEDPSLVPTLTENTVQPAIPGNYHVTWSVTDSDGATATATRSVTVADTTAPAIAPMADVSVTTMSPAGATVEFNLSATDFLGVSELASVPASGSVFPLGTTEVIVSAKDAAGNTATSRFSVTVSLAGPVHQVKARSGGAVPGAGVDPRIPAGAKWRTFQSPALSATGEVAFVGNWTGANAREKGFGLFRNDTLLAANRDEAGVAQFKGIKDPVFRDGSSNLLVPVIRAGVRANVDNAILEYPSAPSAAPVVLATESEQPVSILPGRISQFVTVVGTPERAVIVVKLAGPGITAKNRRLAYAVEAGEANELVAGGPSHLPFNAYRFLLPVPGTLGHGRHECHDGGARFLATIDRQQDAIVKWGARYGWTVESGTGMPTGATGAEEFVWKRFGGAVSSTRDGGEYGFRAQVAAPAFPSKAVFDGVFWRQSTGMRLIAGPGVTTFNEGEQLLTAVSDPVLSSDGEILAFSGKVESGSKTVAAVIAAEREGEPRVIASAGMQAPGLPSGVVFKTFKSLAAPSGVGGPIFVAGLGGKPGYGQSLWAVDRHGDLRCILRAGQTIDEDRVVSFRALEAVNGNSGSARAFNDNAELVWLATFERGASAIVKTTLP